MERSRLLAQLGATAGTIGCSSPGCPVPPEQLHADHDGDWHDARDEVGDGRRFERLFDELPEERVRVPRQPTRSKGPVAGRARIREEGAPGPNRRARRIPGYEDRPVPPVEILFQQRFHRERVPQLCHLNQCGCIFVKTLAAETPRVRRSILQAALRPGAQRFNRLKRHDGCASRWIRARFGSAPTRRETLASSPP